MRAVAQGRVTETGLGGALARAFVISADRDVDLARHGAEFRRGLPQGLAGLAADRLGHLRGPGFQDGLIAFDGVDPVLTRTVRPIREGGAGAVGGGLDLRG